MIVSRAPERRLVALCLVVVGALTWIWAAQRRSVPEVTRYIPVHNDAFLVTSPLKDFWHGFAPHLSPLFRNPPESADSTFLQDQARVLRDELDEKEIKLDDPADLATLGIDGTRSAAMAVLYQGRDYIQVVVLPVLDQKALVRALEKWTQDKAAIDQESHGRLMKVNEFVVGFTPERYAVISTDAALVSALMDPAVDRRKQLASNDRLVRLFATPLPHTSPAWLRGQLHQSSVSSVGGLVDLVVSADELALALESKVDTPASRSALFHSMLQADPVYDAGPALGKGQAIASFGGPQLPQLIRHLTVTGLDEGDLGLGRVFAPILDELSEETRFSQAIVALSDASSQEPGLALGLQMTRKDADALVFRLQTALRQERDSQIVEGAMRSLTADERRQATVASLRQAGVIAPEHDALWARYAWTDHKLELKPSYTPADFANDGYVQRLGPDHLTYIMPPFTDNDVRHRFADKADELRIADLKAGRFRLCSTYDRGVLWIATDAPVLAQWLVKLRETDVDSNYQQVQADAGDIGSMRARLVVRPYQILEGSQVNPDSEVNEWATMWLSDMSSYRIVHLGVIPDPQREEWHVRAIFLR